MTETTIGTTSTIKHLFVMNPGAGRVDGSRTLIEKLRPFDGRLDYEIYLTKGQDDATRYVKEKCREYEGSDCKLRFYACGGDGTICEVVSGLMGSSNKNTQMSCYACGSGNDFIKYYAAQEDFLNIEKLINGSPHVVDVMEVRTMGENPVVRHSINAVDVGFDSVVCKTMIDVKRKPLIGGKNAYTTGIVAAVFKGMNNCCTLTVDGKELHSGKMLLSTFANGRYIGGGYLCAPRSKNDDGLMEVCMLKTMSLLRLIRVIGVYRRGEHFEKRSLARYIKYAQAREVEIRTPKEVHLVIDGELISGSHFVLKQMPGAITFVAPR